MIARNEAARIADCLRPVRDLFAEAILVDTGSTDDTKSLAAALGAKVFEFPWRDDFAAARNECLKHATAPWIFWLDADDRLDPLNRDRLAKLLHALPDEDVAFAMNTFSLAGPDNPIETVVNQVRLFRNLPGTRWEYRVHEQIIPCLRARNADVRAADMTVVHTGYQDEVARRRKLDRNLRLLRLDQADRPDDPFVLFNLGWSLQDLGRHAESVPYLRGALERCVPTASIVRKAYALLVAAHLAARRPAEAFATCQAGLLRCPDDVELRFVLGRLLADRGDLAGAVACLEQLLQPRAGDYFGSIDARLTGYGVHFELGRLHRLLGHSDEAERHLREATDQRPDFLDGWLELADLYLEAARWPDLDNVLKVLERYPQAARTARLLRARAHMARQEFPAARALLEPLSRAYPEDVRPVILLAYAMLQEGADLAAAEAALREVTARAPDLSEPWRNLVVLLRSQKRPDAALAAVRAARQHHPADPELHLLEALAREDGGDVPGARASAEDLIAAHRGAPPASAVAARILQAARETLRRLVTSERAGS